MKELGFGITGAGWFCAKAGGLKYKPRSIPPPPTAVTCKNARRLNDLVCTVASCNQAESHWFWNLHFAITNLQFEVSLL
jgi:hypothetical protein